MKKFQEMCQEEFEKIELMARGGQKIVFDGVHMEKLLLNYIFSLTIPGLLGKYK